MALLVLLLPWFFVLSLLISSTVSFIPCDFQRKETFITKSLPNELRTISSLFEQHQQQQQEEEEYQQQQQQQQKQQIQRRSSVVVGDDDNNLVLPAIPAEWRGEVLKALSNVIDPDLNRDIVTLGFVKNLELANDKKKKNNDERIVSFDVELTTPACPVKEQFAADCERLVLDLPWTTKVAVTMTADMSSIDTDARGLSKVRSVIAVSSCKGGVGKSTTAVNLAYALQSAGASVGIFDADVYGPSLPTMIQPDNDIVQFIGRQIAPLRRDGVSLMSFGYVNEGSAVMRGPMVTQLLDQFLDLVDWGSLDYLILDMPPGTGDIQLTLSQRLNITAAVIVTTPQQLSFADVVRGIEMFDSVNVPCIAVVENMAYFQLHNDNDSPNKKKNSHDSSSSSSSLINEAVLKSAIVDKLNSSPNTNTAAINDVDTIANELISLVQTHLATQDNNNNNNNNNNEEDDGKVRIFGPGHLRRLSEQYGIDHSFSVPLIQDIAASGDSGTPFLLTHPNTIQGDIYRSLADSVIREVGKLSRSNKWSRPLIRYDETKHMMEIVTAASILPSSPPQEEEESSTTTTTTTKYNNEENEISDIIGKNHHQHQLSPATLRRACRCAYCVEEMTGRQILIPSSIPESIRPLSMSPCGNYALSVNWSDGHRSLYPYKQIFSLLEEGEGEDDDEKKKEEKRMMNPIAENMMMR